MNRNWKEWAMIGALVLVTLAWTVMTFWKF